MTCGHDYHGGNQQAGCGQGFNWLSVDMIRLVRSI